MHSVQHNAQRTPTWPLFCGVEHPQIKAALKKLDKEEKEALEKDGSKGKFNSLAGGEDVTPEEMEAWRMKRARGDDPVAAGAAGTQGYDLL